MDASRIGTRFSPDCAYRYTLERALEPTAPPFSGRIPATCLFLMLNPSTADATINDPTITRCIRFAAGWGYSKLLVGNLFALRSTDPKALLAAEDPVGPENDRWLKVMHDRADLTVCAWGAFPLAATRARDLALRSGLKAHALALTKAGQPRHPLYLKGDLRPVEFEVSI